MALPRPALLAILGLALIAAAFLGTRSMRAAEDEPAPPPAKPATATPSPSAPEKAGAKTDRTPARPARAAAAAGEGPVDRLPRRLARAIEDRRLIVLLLAQPGGADDAEVGAAVRALRPLGPRVFVDEITQVDRYAPIAQGVAVGQAPSTIIFTSDRRARLVEGYVDPTTLRQLLVDASR